MADGPRPPGQDRSPGGPRRWLAEMFRVDPPTSVGQGIKRFFVALIVIVPFSLAGSLLFGVIGWSPRVGSAIGLGAGLSLVSWMETARRE